MVQYEVGDVFVGPLFEETCIAILTFGINPHVETLCHHHHAQRVVDLHLHGRRHVVRRTDGVASHILEDKHLTDESIAIDCRPERSEIVV